MGLDSGLVVVAVGDGVGAADTQGVSFCVGNCSVIAIVDVQVDKPLMQWPGECELL